MRRTVLLLLLVALAASAPVAEDADQQSILQMLLTADPLENDIIDNNIIEKNKIIEYEMSSRENVDEELSPTTEYSLDTDIEISTEPIQELGNESVDEVDYTTDDANQSETEIESGSTEVAESVPEVEESVPEVPLNNTTSKDSIIETEDKVEPNIDTEIEEVIHLREEFKPFIIQSPQYAINFPEVTPEVETTNIEESSIEDEFESKIKDEQYNNQEWPQKYPPSIPNYFDISTMEPEPEVHNDEEWPQRYAPGFPETQDYEQPIDNNAANPEMSSNIFGNQDFPIEWMSGLADSIIVDHVGAAYSGWDSQGPEHFVEDGPVVDTFPDIYSDPGTFSNLPEVNQFGGDGMAHGVIEDITIEPIFFNQEPLLYDNTPELPMEDELPEKVLEISDIMYEANDSPKDELELVIVDEEVIDIPQTPIAGEVEQPEDSPIIATAILQDTRPEVDMLGLFDGPEDTIIPERIEETYPLVENDFVKENLPASENVYQIFDQDVTATDNDSFPTSNTPGFGEETDFVLDTFGLPSLIVDLEQAAFPDKPIVNEPPVIPIGNGQFYPIKENEQRIYFQDDIPEFPSEPDFMSPHIHDDFVVPHSHDDFVGPHSHDDSSFGHEFQPHSHNENIYYGDIPYTQQGDQYNQNSYFEDNRGSIKRDGAHIVPDVDLDVDVIDLPIMETGEMDIFRSPMMGSRKPQITVIFASKPEQIKNLWSQFIRPMQQKPYSPVDMMQSQNNGPQFGNMDRFSQNLNDNQFSPNFNRQNFNQYPLQNYNMNDMDMNMNFPQSQLFNSGMSPFRSNINQQENMGSMFPNLNMNFPSFEDLPDFANAEIDRAIEQVFGSLPPSQSPMSSYGPPMYSASNNQQSWPNRYAPNYSEFNYGNNGPFYPQRNMNTNNQFYIP